MCLPLKSSKFSGNIIERYLEQGSFIFAVGAGFVTYITTSFSFFLQVEKGLKRTATDFFAGGSGFETYRHVFLQVEQGLELTASIFFADGTGFGTHRHFFLQVEQGLEHTASIFFADGTGFGTHRHIFFCRWNRVWDVQQRFCYKEERSKLLSSSSVTR